MTGFMKVAFQFLPFITLGFFLYNPELSAALAFISSLLVATFVRWLDNSDYMDKVSTQIVQIKAQISVLEDEVAGLRVTQKNVWDHVKENSEVVEKAVNVINNASIGALKPTKQTWAFPTRKSTRQVEE